MNHNAPDSDIESGIDSSAQPVCDLHRAVLARAERAEAYAADLEQRLDNVAVRVVELEAALVGDIQAITADGRQHRIRRGNWRPYPTEEAAP